MKVPWRACWWWWTVVVLLVLLASLDLTEGKRAKGRGKKGRKYGSRSSITKYKSEASAAYYNHNGFPSSTSLPVLSLHLPSSTLPPPPFQYSPSTSLPVLSLHFPSSSLPPPPFQYSPSTSLPVLSLHFPSSTLPPPPFQFPPSTSLPGAKITTWSHFESEYVLGRKIVFMCKAMGSPRPVITWFKDGIELYAHSFFQVHEWKEGDGDIKSKMEIDPATQMDAGYYECQADNKYAVDVKGFSADYLLQFE
ncbi:hypothetical protein Pmani_038599 [Petrolisthes manimaculis]|uniref:Ig-like domain-containing protein n=1 Tax=Petrolisthes manimaculis TaxID=1843537 RepID=A0AAE1NGK7_9EUCA|nr:hypothetical protein Pmani_038599 [Petrolisthes manimaculis]